MTPEGAGAKPVDVAAIERELAGLWADPAARSGEEAAPGADAVTRACMSNLVIWCGSPEEARDLPSEIGAIVEKHPARVLLLVGDARGASPGLEASVTAVCHVAGPERGRVCSEHVTLEAGRDAERSLPPTVRALLIGDLPSALWWTSAEPPPGGGALFQELASMVDHVIWDSAGWSDPVRGMLTVTEWAAAAGAVRTGAMQGLLSDLAWRRLKPWRWMVSQALDPRLEPFALRSLEEIEIEHGPHALPHAWFLIGWLASRLGWLPRGGKVAPGVEIDFGFDTEAGPIVARACRLGEGAAEVARVRIAWREGGTRREATFSRAGADRLEAALDAAPPRLLAAPRLPRAALVARQLPKRFRDPVFRESLALARAMAETLSS